MIVADPCPGRIQVLRFMTKPKVELNGAATVVFVVLSGRYDDYGLNAVFSTRDKAASFVEENAALFVGRDPVDVIEMIVDTSFTFGGLNIIDLNNV